MSKIDLGYLTDITGGDAEIMVEMIDLFLVETPKHIINMRSELANEEWQNVGAEVHKLKPTLLYVGLKDLHEVALALEENGRKEKNLDDIPGLINDIEDGFNEVIDELKEKKAELLN
ncbi:MAG: Hpt domain-containing protein [Balneolaceae bacterium]|nr:Hpt domain-containing protein [Balneolaceae bacterium]